MERCIIHRLVTFIFAICNDKRKALKVEGTGLLNFVSLDSHQFWIYPFGELDKFTVKVYENSARYLEYENGWELLEK